MTFQVDEPRIGVQPIAGIDTGLSYTSPGGVTTIIPSPPSMLGNIIRAFDPVLGEGEFILLKGVAGTVVGSCVIWDGAFATTLAPATVMQARPVAFAMSANVNPAQFGWYQIGGIVTADKDTSLAVNPNVPVGIVSAGKIGNTGVGLEIENARSVNTAIVAAPTTTLQIEINRPHLQGRIT